jgi:hypothetical protein
VQPIHRLIVDIEPVRPDIWWTVEPYNQPTSVEVQPIIGVPPTPGGHYVPLPPSQLEDDPIPYIP